MGHNEQLICLNIDETDTYEILHMSLLKKLSCFKCLLAFEACKTEEYCSYEWGSHMITECSSC